MKSESSWASMAEFIGVLGPSLLEMHAIAISKLVRSGDRIEIGANLPAFWAGVMLANFNEVSITLQQSLCVLDTNEMRDASIPIAATAFGIRGATGFVRFYEVFDDFRRAPDLFAVGGMEVDPFGNTNLAGIPGESHSWKKRGPGPIGTTTMCAIAKRFVIMMNRHSRTSFVEHCTLTTGLGWGEGGESAYRAQYGGGPVMLLSPLGIFSFPNPEHRLTLRSLSPGVTVEELQDATGFDIVVDRTKMISMIPTESELAALRSGVDRYGVLRNG
jgi:glutaconate CoA-transferase subunit B